VAVPEKPSAKEQEQAKAEPAAEAIDPVPLVLVRPCWLLYQTGYVAFA